MATQIAVLIGKIARYDCPRSWPQLVPTLLAAVRTNDALCQQRALLTFYHVAKVLASKRLMHDRKLFEEVAGKNDYFQNEISLFLFLFINIKIMNFFVCYEDLLVLKIVRN